MTTTKPRQIPVCESCGSDDVTADACARWNVDAQEWELVTLFDNTDCQNCNGECRVRYISAEAYDPLTVTDPDQ